MFKLTVNVKLSKDPFITLFLILWVAQCFIKVKNHHIKKRMEDVQYPMIKQVFVGSRISRSFVP